MSGSEHARPVWLTPHQREWLAMFSETCPTAADRIGLAGIVVAWDAAPADPTEAIARALYDNGTEIASIDGDDWDTESDFIKQGYRESEAVAVLRALGMPS